MYFSLERERLLVDAVEPPRGVVLDREDGVDGLVGFDAGDRRVPREGACCLRRAAEGNAPERVLAGVKRLPAVLAGAGKG